MTIYIVTIVTVVGFSGVECGVEIYQYTIEELKIARENAGVEQVHINAPTGNQWSMSDYVSIVNIIDLTSTGNEAGDRGLAAVPGRQSDFNESLNKALQYAKGLGCKR